MANTVRYPLEFAGARYHVTARGDRREAIFEDDEDRLAFLNVLAEVVERFNWRVHAYCLMDNHYHLLIETLGGNLSNGMRQLNGVYTQTSNRRHRRVGHLFQGRYKAILVQKETYLLELARYIVLNPVRARIVRSASPVWLTTDWILSASGGRARDAQLAYRRYVSDGRNQPSPWESLTNQVFLGDDAFADAMQTRIRQIDRPLAEVPRRQRAGRARPLAEYAEQTNTRHEAMALAYAAGGYSMAEIGAYFGVHYSTVSRAVRTHEKKRAHVGERAGGLIMG